MDPSACSEMLVNGRAFARMVEVISLTLFGDDPIQICQTHIFDHGGGTLRGNIESRSNGKRGRGL